MLQKPDINLPFFTYGVFRPGEKREIVRFDDPKTKITFIPKNPKKSIEYYYQVRCNITHRGKTVYADYEKVKMSFHEFLQS